MDTNKELTLDRKTVKEGAKTRSPSVPRSTFQQWYVGKADDGREVLTVRDESNIPNIINPEAGDPALIEIRFDVSKGRVGRLELQPVAFFLVDGEEIPIDTVVECQAWKVSEEPHQAPLPNGDEYMECDADAFAVQFVATNPLHEILSILPVADMATVGEKGQLRSGKETSWLSARFYKNYDTGLVNINATPSFGIVGYKPPMPDTGDRLYERNGTPSKAYTHAQVGDKTLFARSAVRCLSIDEGIRDVHVRLAVTPHLMALLKEHTKFLADVTHEQEIRDHLA